MQVLVPEMRPGSVVVTEKLLRRYIGSGMYGVSQWIRYCLFMMDRGYVVSLYCAKATVSKYVTVHGINDTAYTVRFSNHKPNLLREARGDCDFFCGVTHTGVRTTLEAIQACLKHFGAYDRVTTDALVQTEQSTLKDENLRRTARQVGVLAGRAVIYH